MCNMALCMSKATVHVHQQEHKPSRHVPCKGFHLFPLVPNDETKSVEHVMYRDQQKIVFNKTQKNIYSTDTQEWPIDKKGQHPILQQHGCGGTDHVNCKK